MKERKTYSIEGFFANIIREVSKKYNLSESQALEKILQQFIPVSFARYMAKNAQAEVVRRRDILEVAENISKSKKEAKEEWVIA